MNDGGFKTGGYVTSEQFDALYPGQIEVKIMKTKIVTYLGRKYNVPNCAKFMATDKDGTIFWYVELPQQFRENSGYWIPMSNLYGEAILMCTNKDPLPEHSLREI